MDEPIVTLAHCRTLGYCAHGMRTFFARHGLDWAGFREHGAAASVIEATGDSMAIAAAQLARDEAEQGEQ